jgi:hypothetical protein
VPACVKNKSSLRPLYTLVWGSRKNPEALFENRSDSTLRAQIHTRKRRSSGIISIALHDLRPPTDVTEDRLEKSLHTTLWGLVKKWSDRPKCPSIVRTAK